MKTILDQHERALGHCAVVVAAVRPDDLRRTTPCRDWDLGALLAHMAGQNEGFALAVAHAHHPGTPASDDEPGVAAFAPRAFGEPGFGLSLRHVREAFAAADPAGLVLLPEVSARRIPVPFVAGMHLIDTLVHTWDVATSLGRPWRPPEPDLVEAALTQALMVPDGDRRTRPGASFAPALPEGGDEDPWPRALRLLGRDQG